MPCIIALLYWVREPPFLSFDGSSNVRYFAAGTTDGLPEHFVGLPVVGIQFMSELLPSLHFGLFHRECCGISRLSLPRMQRRVAFVMKPCLVGYFCCSNSIFHLLVLPRVTVLPLFPTPSHFRPHTQAADEAATALNRRHSTSASSVHYGNSRNKDNTLSPLTFLSTRASHFTR